VSGSVLVVRGRAEVVCGLCLGAGLRWSVFRGRSEVVCASSVCILMSKKSFGVFIYFYFKGFLIFFNLIVLLGKF
jgi:hypothetical protein